MSNRNNLRTLKVLKSALHLGVSYLTIGIMTVQPLYAAGALPTGANVVAGDVSVSSTATSTEVTQTSAAGIVNWSSFSIGEGNTVQFNNGTGATLNRVTGDTISSIDGTLSATGSVYLINQNGVIVGRNGVINVGGGFVASTLDVLDDDFLNGGDTTFAGSSKAAVVNYGKIGALGGDVALIAAKVDNEGSIDAQAGTAALVAGYEVLMRDASVADGKFVVKVGGTDTEARNSGGIKAADAELRAVDGNVYALAGNTGGYVNATGVSSSDGRVFLTAEGGTVSVGGTVSAQKANGAGGTIVATGNAVEVGATAKLKADGATGGTILLGGDQYGSQDASRKLVDFDVANASTTVVYDGAEISANGTNGNGGNVVLWSNDYTYLGSSAVSATGAGAGNGGFAEVSSKGVLDFQGFVNLGAANGTAGTLLLDPYSLTISASANNSVNGVPSGPTYTSNGGSSVLNVTTLTNQLANSDVTVQTGGGSPGAGNLTVATAINWSSNSSLTLNAHNDITVNSAIGWTGNGSLSMNAGNDITVNSAIGWTGSGSLSLDANDDIAINSGLTWTGNGSVTLDAHHNLAIDGAIANTTSGLAGLNLKADDSITQTAAIQVANLNIQDHTNGGAPSVALTNAGNAVTTLTGGANGNHRLGDFSFTNSKSLTIGSAGLHSIGTVTVVASGAGSNITLASGAQGGIDTSANTTLTVAAGGNFINNAGSSALDTGFLGRWLVYAGSSVGNTYGDLDSGHQAIWGKSYGQPLGAGSGGNRYVFADDSGTLSVTLDPLSKVYGTTYTFSSGDIASASLNTSHVAVANAYQATTGSTTNLTSGQIATIALSSTGAAATANVGSYNVNATYGAYSTTVTNGLSVTKATLTVTAKNQSKTYGQTVTFGGSDYTVSGLKNSDTVTSATLTSSGAAASANAGSYDILVSNAAGTGLSNYNISYAKGTLTVNKATLTVTTQDASKTYGDANPTLTATYSGFVNGDTKSVINTLATVTTTANAQTGVGTYAITASGASDNNYTFTYANTGLLTINKAALTVTAKNQSKTYGDAFTFDGTEYTVSGLKNSDAVTSATLTSSGAAASANAGSYAISASNAAGTGLSNYTINYVDGTFSVGKAA
ncbi:MBG domain-containing protein, partial [Parvibaculum sp.]|uniref:beta strand repeat-containing protein n=1 Tax=Parvibaculum sp. TaxID=2024848 RepID=UPI003210E85F